MATRKIPLTADPNQTFAITLPVDGKNIDLIFELHYNTEALYWAMDIYDAERNPLLAAIPMLPGVYPSADILGQYRYLGIGSAYIMPSGKTVTGRPNDENLGSEFYLIWSDTNGK